MRIAVFGYLGGRGPCFSPCSRPVIALLFGAGFRAKGHLDQSVSEKSGRKRPVSGEICRSRPQRSSRKCRIAAASPPRLLQIRCICSKTALARRAPRHNRDRGAFSPAANPLQMQPDAHRIAARSGGRMPTSGMRCRGAVIPMSGVISSAVGIRRPARCIG